MQDYSFRNLFYFPKSNSLSSPSHSIDLSVATYPTFSIFAEEDKSLQDSKTFYCTSSGYQSHEEAAEVGEKVRDSLTLAFAHNRIGADFGHGIPRGGFTQYLIDKLKKEQNLRVLNDVHGLMVYETTPPVSFVSISPISAGLSTPPEKFVDDFRIAFASDYRLSERERASYSLFSDSFFAPTATSRLIFLVMAVESLVDPQKKSPEAINYINAFKERIGKAEDLQESEMQSLLGSLTWLCDESRSRGCRRIIETRMGDAIVDNKPAIKFFEECYSYRSSLVHGLLPYPSREIVRHAGARLEVMVSKLISSCIKWTNE